MKYKIFTTLIIVSILIAMCLDICFMAGFPLLMSLLYSPYCLWLFVITIPICLPILVYEASIIYKCFIIKKF